MKIVILAGGFGTRLDEYTQTIPKPMVSIGGKPILIHIMKTFAKYNFTDFNLALGYKAEVIKEYFLHYRTLSADFSVDFKTGTVTPKQADELSWKVSLIDTGMNTMTGGRVKRIQSEIGQNRFLLTYGDGLANININDLVNFHKQHGKMITVTAVHPSARFGELDIVDNRVTSFKEKPQTSQGWINGGFFVIEPEFFNLIEGDSTILEQEPLEKAAELGELMAYQHDGFWHCMDTKRDRDVLEELWLSGNPPWV